MMDEQRLAVMAGRTRFAVSGMAMLRSASRTYVNACLENGDAAAKGDQEAADRIREASELAGQLSDGAIGLR